MRGRGAWGGFAVLAAAAAAAATVQPSASAQSAPTTGGQEIVLNGENNRLNAYDAATGTERTTPLIPSAADAPGTGLDINAEICFIPDGVSWKPTGEIWFIAGEDTEQNQQAGVIRQGWGIFRLTGTTLEGLATEELGKLVPHSFVTAEDNPENFGCGVLPDGRLVTGDVGDQLPTSPATGQLIVWYPTAAHFGGPIGEDRTIFEPVPHCKIDVALGTAGGIEVDDRYVYIASNRPNQATGEPGGIYRYEYDSWPTGPTAADGCGRTDSAGGPLADADRVGKELFIPQVPGLLTTPSDIVHSGRGTFYISSVFTGQVSEFGTDGIFRRFVVNTSGQLGGITPFGIDVTSDGSLWIADIGIQGPGPAEGEGSVVRVRFDEADEPGEPEVIDEGLEFPDGIGSVVLPGGAAAGPSGPTGGTPAGPSGSVPGAERSAGGNLARTGPPAVPVAALVLLVAAALATRRLARAR